MTGRSSAVAKAIDWSAFPCALGDVIVRSSDGAEAWLAGALVLREDVPAAVLFVAPERSQDRAIYARVRPNDAIVWLAPIAGEALLVGNEPPSVLEIDGTRFERARRLPLRVQRMGEGVPDLGATAILGEYASGRGEVVVVLVGAAVLAFRGERLAAGEFEAWRPPSGRET